MSLEKILSKGLIATRADVQKDAAMAHITAQVLPMVSTRPSLAKAVAAADAAPVLGPVYNASNDIDGSLATLYDMISGAGSVEVPRIQAMTAIDNIAKTFSDVKTVMGKLVSVSPELKQLNQNSYAFSYEPELIDRQLSDHVPFDVNVNPEIVAFDANGDGSLAGVPFSSALIKSNITRGKSLNIGWLFLVQGNNTDYGQTSVTFASSSGVTNTFMLKDVNTMGGVVIMNHQTDYNTNVVPDTSSVVAGVLQNTISDSTSTQPNQYYQSFDNSDMATTISGKNVVIYCYPIFNQRSIAALMKALVYSDHLPLFADYVRVAAGVNTVM